MSQVQAYSRLAGVYDEIVVEPCYERWATYLHELWKSDPTPVRTVLDVGCGTGLLAFELVALGRSVVGVDASGSMLARARQRLGPDAVLLEQTLPELRVDGDFDAIVSSFDVLNYLGPEQLKATITTAAAHLRAGGWFIFDLHTDAMMDFTAANAIVSGEAEGQHFTIRSVVDPAARTCDTWIDIRRLSDGDSFAEHHRQFFHTDAEVEAALSGAGLSLVTVTDDYTREAISDSTLRSTWVARFPEARHG